MRKYAIWGTADVPKHEEWVAAIGKQFEDGHDFSRGFDDLRRADADFVLNMFDVQLPESVQARLALHAEIPPRFHQAPSQILDDVLKASYPMPPSRTPLHRPEFLRIPGDGLPVHDDGGQAPTT